MAGPYPRYMCQCPVRAAAYTLPSSLRLCLPCSLYAYPCASHGGLLLFLSVKNEEPRSEAFFLYWHSRPPSRQSPPPLPTPRHGIESSRHGVRMDGERETEKERKKKKKIKRTSGETARSGTKIARHAGNRVKGSERERERERGSEVERAKEREGWNKVGRRFPIAKRGSSRSDDDRKR